MGQQEDIATLKAEVSHLEKRGEANESEHQLLFKSLGKVQVSIAELRMQHDTEATAIKESLQRIETGVYVQNEGGNSKMKSRAMTGGGVLGGTSLLYLLVDRVVQSL
jgi:predicted  nucleic acid-binding Zn-ribbon protein